MRWTEQTIYFIDFEGARASGILEYGIVTVQGGAVAEARTRLCSATGKVRREDVDIHGLSGEALAGNPPFSDDWELFAGLRERGPFAAHYAGVENGLLKAVWPYPRSSPDFARSGEWIVDWGPWIDSARLYAQLFPGLESGRLEAIVNAFGLKPELDDLAARHCSPGRRRYHAALYDALAGALLLAALARQPGFGDMTVMQLIALSTLDPARRDSIVQRDLF